MFLKKYFIIQLKDSLILSFNDLFISIFFLSYLQFPAVSLTTLAVPTLKTSDLNHSVCPSLFLLAST